MMNHCYKINGTQINYYFICKTKLWLFSHNIRLEHESDNVALGKQLHEDSFKKEKEFLIDDLINIDFIKINDSVEIHEVKKTQKMEESHIYQLLYYMFYLKNEKDIKLYFHGIELKDMDKTLEEYGLKDKDVIVIHVKHEIKCNTKAR